MKSLILFSMMAFLFACSPSDDDKQVSEEQYQVGYAPPASNGNKNNGDIVSIPIYIGPKDGSFGLADATNFSILLDGCQTGWTTTATKANPSLDVYKDDKDCVAKLISFSFDGVDFVIKTDFNDWQINDTAIFKNSLNAADTMEVRVVDQLDKTAITGLETIEYAFYELASGGTGTVLEDDVGDPHALTMTGQSAPDFVIKSIAFQGVNATGGGKFVVRLECQDEDIAAHKCKENSMVDMSYILVLDDYPALHPDIDDARDVFADPADPVTVATDEVAPVPLTDHGGFNTVQIEGPDEMHNNPDMILFLRVDAHADDDLSNDSFTYFRIHVQTLSYP